MDVQMGTRKNVFILVLTCTPAVAHIFLFRILLNRTRSDQPRWTSKIIRESGNKWYNLKLLIIIRSSVFSL